MKNFLFIIILFINFNLFSMNLIGNEEKINVEKIVEDTIKKQKARIFTFIPPKKSINLNSKNKIDFTEIFKKLKIKEITIGLLISGAAYYIYDFFKTGNLEIDKLEEDFKDFKDKLDLYSLLIVNCNKKYFNIIDIIDSKNDLTKINNEQLILEIKNDFNILKEKIKIINTLGAGYLNKWASFLEQNINDLKDFKENKTILKEKKLKKN